MARRRKFTNEELTEITKQAITHITGAGLFQVDIRASDIANYAMSKFPGFEYSDARKEPVKKVIEEYRKERDVFLNRYNKKVKDIKRYLKNLDKVRLISDIRTGVMTLEETIEYIIDNINTVITACQRTERENERLRNQICLLANDSDERITNMFEQLIQKEDKIKELERIVEKYKKEMDELDDKAAREVIAACHLANVKVDHDPRAQVLTYLDFTERKRERLKKLKKEREDEK